MSASILLFPPKVKEKHEKPVVYVELHSAASAHGVYGGVYVLVHYPNCEGLLKITGELRDLPPLLTLLRGDARSKGYTLEVKNHIPEFESLPPAESCPPYLA
jgi:hypothetical protein